NNMGNRADENIIAATRRQVFRGVEYVVSLVVNKEENQFVLEVEDRLTADQWRGQFDAKYIEDLTHKTGNFKQFPIFVNMLESALSKLMKGSRGGAMIHLQKECENAIRERDEIQAQFDIFQREIKHADKANTAKEIRILKKVVQNLESDSMKEKSKYQRSLNKKNQEYRSISDELEEIRASERNLRARCRSLTNELAVFKRGSRISPSTSVTTQRSSSRTSLRDRRSTSRERPAMVRDRRSTSTDRRSASRDRITSARRRMPSPAGSSSFLFSLTCNRYVKDKQRKAMESQDIRGGADETSPRIRARAEEHRWILEHEESDAEMMCFVPRRKRTRSNGSLTRGRSRSLSTDRNSRLVPSVEKGSTKGRRRPSSVGSTGSRRSSQSSMDGVLSDHSNEPTRRRSSRTKRKTPNLTGKENRKAPARWSSPEASDLVKLTVLVVHVQNESLTAVDTQAPQRMVGRTLVPKENIEILKQFAQK
ncbi:hypothetical protein QZH41_013465, partial [Actinostola sp. cb2023]